MQAKRKRSVEAIMWNPNSQRAAVILVNICHFSPIRILTSLIPFLSHREVRDFSEL